MTNISWNNAYYGRNNVLPPDILIRRTATSPKSHHAVANAPPI